MYKFNPNFYADVRIEERYASSIAYKNGQLESMVENTTKKAFIRVFDGQMWYYTSSTDVGNVQQELDELYTFATPNSGIASHPVVQRFQVNVDQVIKFADNKVCDVSMQTKHETLQTKLALVKSQYAGLITGLYKDRYSMYQFYSSKGASIKYDFQHAGSSFSMALANGEDKFSTNQGTSSDNFDQAFDTDQTIASWIEESHNFLLNAKPLESAGSFPVVLAPVVAGVFAHESFGHKSESDFMLGDETLAKEWSIGKKVGSSVLSILETGTIAGGGYVPYDDEGTKATQTYLIKDGILTGRLHSATTAAYLGEEVTGNARAVSCDFEPIVRMTNTVIQAGNSTFEELVAGISKGYYIKDYKHGSGASTFTIAPNMAYEIVDGKIGNPVKIAVITGNVFETLGLIDGASKEVEVFSSITGGCGKMEQSPLNVGLGGPYVRVSKMNVQ